MLKKFEMAFVGPYPQRDLVREGWMSRVYTIDQSFSDVRRIYIQIDLDLHGNQQKLVQIDDKSAVFYCNPLTEYGADSIRRIVNKVKAVYCHTLHMAEHVIDYLSTGKICVDIHGITPEEEAMLGNHEDVEKYTFIESRILEEAKLCIFVTNAMAEHYSNKYPEKRFKWTKVGIFEKYKGVAACEQENSTRREIPVTTVYAGGIQPWQNLDKMIDCTVAAKDFSVFRFYSHEHDTILKKIPPEVLSVVECGFCPKESLPEVYQKSQFGFVIRSDTPVNRVACPTKLIEYLCYQVIPIVDLINVGDFYDFGYEYIHIDDFCDSFFPDSTSRNWMTEKNLSVANHMRLEFEQATASLKDRVLS